MTDTTEHTPWPLVGATAPPVANSPTSTFADEDAAPPAEGVEVGPNGPMEPEGRGNPLRIFILIGMIAAIGVFGGWPWLAIIGALIASIFLHEMGHYLVAKKAGMKVTEYFIGFGPRIWSFKRGETEYGVKVIPAGAYVRIIGMSNLEEVEPADEDRTYRSKGYWKRLPVILAGPFANFAIALVLLFVLLAGFGLQDENDWTVGAVVPGSAAEAAGLQSGDTLVSVDGQETGSFDDFFSIVEPLGGQSVDVVYVRDGVEHTTQTTPGWRIDADAADALRPVQVGIQEGDIIRSVDGVPASTYVAFQQALASATGSSTVTFESANNGNDLYTIEIPGPVVLPDGGSTGFFGIGHEPAAAERMSVPSALGNSATEFGSIVVASVKGIGDLFSPSGLSGYWDTLSETTKPEQAVPEGLPKAVPVESSTPALEQAPPPLNLNRPTSIIGIAQIGSSAAEQGAVPFLGLLIAVNIFLGLFNLVPLPPLDGGHAAIATYEAIRGKIRGRAYRVDMAKLMPVVYAAFAFLTLFGLSAMYLDIADPISLGG